MTDDIVTRLRGQACPECGLPSTHNQFDEAADEIERLRRQSQEWQALAEKAINQIEEWRAICQEWQDRFNALLGSN